MGSAEPLFFPMVIPLTRENVAEVSVLSGRSVEDLHKALDLVEPHGYTTTVRVWGPGKGSTIFQTQAQAKK